MEDLPTQCGQKRCVKMVVLNLSVLPIRRETNKKDSSRGEVFVYVRMVRLARVERATLCLGGRCSIHLSYNRRKRIDSTKNTRKVQAVPRLSSLPKNHISRSRRPHHRFAVPLPRTGRGRLMPTALSFPRRAGGESGDRAQKGTPDEMFRFVQCPSSCPADAVLRQAERCLLSGH